MSSTGSSVTACQIPGLAQHLENGGTIDQFVAAQRRSKKSVKVDDVVMETGRWLAQGRGRESPALIAQLQEMNVRSRTYMAQAWQVPFAYAAGVAVLAGVMVDKAPAWQASAACLALAAVIGGLVLVHQRGVTNGSHRAVHNIQAVEAALGLARTSEWVGRDVFGAITWVIALVAGFCLGAFVVVVVRA